MLERRTLWLLAGLAAGIVAGGAMGGLAASFSSLPSFKNRPSPAVELIRRYGCAGCHQIPGVPAARGRVGPPLEGVGDRRYLAGTIQNSPENLVDWIVDPRSMVPHTAMPMTGISEPEARTVAQYLLAH
ncbi:MAG TPA: c-type cytochrome [Geminicoccus sp.]|jgi:mono/diheme cytochrome c family protein|uniref:c-type cytochrome n=1 Tax=Geminicoccus sp. TaxID=2024832 RepID=UPI002E35BAC4|nr:c-type cytochrome [Geminicoccus sp.]HEX2528920.1 c-type cytochrome [Geminicoccus sp.]